LEERTKTTFPLSQSVFTITGSSAAVIVNHDISASASPLETTINRPTAASLLQQLITGMMRREAEGQ
jgi:hypothetical protein